MNGNNKYQFSYRNSHFQNETNLRIFFLEGLDALLHPKIFLSYNSKNSFLAEKICKSFFQSHDSHLRSVEGSICLEHFKPKSVSPFATLDFQNILIRTHKQMFSDPDFVALNYKTDQLFLFQEKSVSHHRNSATSFNLGAYIGRSACKHSRLLEDTNILPNVFGLLKVVKRLPERVEESVKEFVQVFKSVARKAIKKLRKQFRRYRSIDIRYTIRTIIRTLRIHTDDGKDAESDYLFINNRESNSFSVIQTITVWTKILASFWKKCGRLLAL